MSYTRSDRDSRIVLDYWKGQGFCPASTQNGTTTAKTLLSWANVTSGEKNPQRRRQIARGENASTTYSKSKHEVNIPGVECSVFWTESLTCPTKKRGEEYRIWNVAGLTLEANDPSLISLSVADNRARQNAFKAIRARQTAFQGGTWVGELAETLHMIRGRGRDLFKGVMDYATAAKKHGRVPNIKERIRRVSNLYLERAYGWAPLMADIRSGNNWLEQRLNQYDPTYPFKGTGDDSTVTSTAGSSSKSDRCKVKFVKHRETHARVSYYGRVEGGVTGGRMLMEARLLGFDPSNWLPTAWELIPYSFLVDYFTNVGDVISSWSTCTSGVRWCSSSSYRSYVTHVTDLKWDIDGVKAAMGAAYSTFAPSGRVSSFGKHRVARSQITRSRDAVLEPPRLEFTIPGLGMKWLNMGALAVARSFG